MKLNRNVRTVAAALFLSLLCACSAAPPKDGVSSDTASPSIPPAESSVPPSAEESAALGVFSATDLDGEPVDQTVFEGHKLTMVNVWGTFCGPCIVEMPHLGKLNEKYADDGFQVVGIVVDTLDREGNPVPAQLDTAREIVEKTGAAYTHLIPNMAMMTETQLVDAIYIPYTFFVDSSGMPVGDALTGGKDEAEWETIIQERLNSLSS